MGAFLTYGIKEYLQKDIFVYTIACPNTYRVHPPSEIEFEIGVCENIFNIVNSRDNIPYYPLTLKRFGRDITFESGNTSFNPVNENHKIGNYIDYILNSSDL